MPVETIIQLSALLTVSLLIKAAGQHRGNQSHLPKWASNTQSATLLLSYIIPPTHSLFQRLLGIQNRCAIITIIKEAAHSFLQLICKGESKHLQQHRGGSGGNPSVHHAGLRYTHTVQRFLGCSSIILEAVQKVPHRGRFTKHMHSQQMLAQNCCFGFKNSQIDVASYSIPQRLYTYFSRQACLITALLLHVAFRAWKTSNCSPFLFFPDIAKLSNKQNSQTSAKARPPRLFVLWLFFPACALSRPLQQREGFENNIYIHGCHQLQCSSRCLFVYSFLVTCLVLCQIRFL